MFPSFPKIYSQLESTSDISQFLSKKVYLHYFDRDVLQVLSQFEILQYSDLKTTFLLSLLSTNENFYFSASLLMENSYVRDLISNYKKLFTNLGPIEITIKEKTFEDFLYVKRKQHSANKEDYIPYFEDYAKILLETDLNFLHKEFDTTQDLEKGIVPDLKSGGLANLSKQLGFSPDYKTIKLINPYLIHSILERDEKGITGNLFNDVFNRFGTNTEHMEVARLKVEEHYINTYIDRYDATICNNLKINLPQFNFLTRTFPFHDLSIWQVIYDSIGAWKIIEVLTDEEIIELRSKQVYISFIDAIRGCIFKNIKLEIAKREDVGNIQASTIKMIIVQKLRNLILTFPFKNYGLNELIYSLESQIHQLNENDSEVGKIIKPKNYHLIDMKKPKDIGILIALKEEFKEIFPHINKKGLFDEEYEMVYYEFELFDKHKAVASFIGEMGPSNATLYSERMLNRYNVDVMINLGIAGSLKKSNKLGDVIIASIVDGYMETSKVADVDLDIENFEDGFTFIPSGDVFRTTNKYNVLFNNLDFGSNEELIRSKKNSYSYLTDNVDAIQIDQLKSKEYINELPEYKLGRIASGPAVNASEKWTRWLKRRDRKFDAVEMEALGLMKASYSRRVNTIIIRGISDFSNFEKEEIDDIEDGVMRRYAMRNAINLLKLLSDKSII